MEGLGRILQASSGYSLRAQIPKTAPKPSLFECSFHIDSYLRYIYIYDTLAPISPPLEIYHRLDLKEKIFFTHDREGLKGEKGIC